MGPSEKPPMWGTPNRDDTTRKRLGINEKVLQKASGPMSIETF